KASPTRQRREGRALSENHLSDDHDHDIDRVPLPAMSVTFWPELPAGIAHGLPRNAPDGIPAESLSVRTTEPGGLSGSLNSPPTPSSSLVSARHPRPVNGAAFCHR